MARYRPQLPQLDAPVFLTDGGIETTLIFDEGFELDHFAAFVLFDREDGRAALTRYFDSYASIASRDGVGVVLETATWRSSPDWGARLGYDADRLADINRAAVSLLEEVRARHESASTPVVISGCIGPRGDGYRAEGLMGVAEARAYHQPQARAFAESNADLVTAITMTYAAEASGIALAAKEVGMPVVISFTVETDGSLPSGQSLSDAIAEVDAATGDYPAYYMVNCAHPTHFEHVLEPGAAWTQRLGGIRANASWLSHAELDAADTLDTGDPVDLARRYADLRQQHPQLVVLGGCCGTDHRHIDRISAACANAN